MRKANVGTKENKTSTLYTAEGEAFDQTKLYYFYDESKREILTSISLRLSGEHLCSFGWDVVRVDRLRSARSGAVEDAKRCVGEEIANAQRFIRELETVCDV